MCTLIHRLGFNEYRSQDLTQKVGSLNQRYINTINYNPFEVMRTSPLGTDIQIRTTVPLSTPQTPAAGLASTDDLGIPIVTPTVVQQTMQHDLVSFANDVHLSLRFKGRHQA